jgi:glycosyltransferase involved in cell wall biosynthesis
MMLHDKADNREIRIVIVGPSPRFLSGISYYTLRLSNALSRKMLVTSLLFRHMLPKRFFPGWRRVGNDLTTLYFADEVCVRELLDWYNPFSWVRGIRLFRNTDVVILEWWTSSVAHMFLALQILNFYHKPILIEFHEVVDPFEHSIGPIRVYSRVMGRLIRRLADRYAAHSEHDKKLIASQYHIPEDQIVVIPHGLYDHYPVLNQEEEKRNLHAEGLFVFLFFGLIRPYKGVVHLIHAFEMLPAGIRDFSLLLIVGEAWEDKISLKAAHESLVSERIHFLNRYVSDHEVPQFFSAADALILPYVRASQSGVAHIGISYGLPVVASKVGGIAESLVRYEGTVFVHPSDEEDLSLAMAQVFKTGPARYQVPEHLRWESVAEEYCSVISRMACWERG